MAKLNFKLFLAIILFLILPTEQFLADNNSFGFESIWINLIIYSLMLFVIIVVFKRLWQFHGAEHKAYNVYTSGKALTLHAVNESSRISEYCGTNMAVMAIPVIILFSYVNTPALLLIAALPLSYEIFNFSNRKWRLKLAYLIGGFIQKYIVTSEPTEEQLILATETLIRAIELENNQG